MLRGINPPFFPPSPRHPQPTPPPFHLPPFRQATPDMADSDSDCTIFGQRARPSPARRRSPRHRSERPASTAPQLHARQTPNMQPVIDLTDDSPVQRPSGVSTPLFVQSPPVQPKREERPAKRRRIESEEPGQAAEASQQASTSQQAGTSQQAEAASSSRTSTHFAEIDLTQDDDEDRVAAELDLTGVDSDVGLTQLQEAQKRRHEAQTDVQAQQTQLLQNSIEEQVPKASGPLKLGQLQCVICLDNITNATALHCGHLFCHTCIMEALIANERQSENPNKVNSTCPMCRRKALRAPKTGGPQVIPLELKLVTRGQLAKGKAKKAG